METQLPVLNGDRVTELFQDCEFRRGEDQDQRVFVDGPIAGLVSFQRQRLASHRVEIAVMLAELPDAFQLSNGGDSILRAGYDRNHHRWAYLDLTVEELVQLAIGADLAAYCLPVTPNTLLSKTPHFMILPHPLQKRNADA